MDFRPAGPRALLVVFEDLLEVRRYYAEALRRRCAGEFGDGVEIVPAARTILFDEIDNCRALASHIEQWVPGDVDGSNVRSVEIPVVYDGPDLGEVADLWGVTPAEAAKLHSAIDHRVAFIGFSPGFAYIAGLPKQLRVSRLASPRTRVPGGSVAIADEFSAVYPRDSPGGWRLIGRTDVVMWDIERSPASHLAAGDAVRFVPVC